MLFKKLKFKYFKNKKIKYYGKKRIIYKNKFYNNYKIDNIYCRYITLCRYLNNKGKKLLYWEFLEKFAGYINLKKNLYNKNFMLYDKSLSHNIVNNNNLKSFKLNDYLYLRSTSLSQINNEKCFYDFMIKPVIKNNHKIISFFLSELKIGKLKYDLNFIFFKKYINLNHILINNIFTYEFNSKTNNKYIYYNMIKLNIIINIFKEFNYYIINKFFKLYLLFNLKTNMKFNDFKFIDKYIYYLFYLRGKKNYHFLQKMIFKNKLKKRYIMKTKLLNNTKILLNKNKLNKNNIIQSILIDDNYNHNYHHININYRGKIKLNVNKLQARYKRFYLNKNFYLIYFFLKKYYFFMNKIINKRFYLNKINNLNYFFLKLLINFKAYLLSLNKLNINIYIWYLFKKLLNRKKNNKKKYKYALYIYFLNYVKKFRKFLCKYIRRKLKYEKKYGYASSKYKDIYSKNKDIINKLKNIKWSKPYYSYIVHYLKINNIQELFKAISIHKKFLKSLNINIRFNNKKKFIKFIFKLNHFLIFRRLRKRIKRLKFYFWLFHKSLGHLIKKHINMVDNKLIDFYNYGNNYIYIKKNIANVDIIKYYYWGGIFLNSNNYNLLFNWFYYESWKSVLKYKMIKNFKKYQLIKDEINEAKYMELKLIKYKIIKNNFIKSKYNYIRLIEAKKIKAKLIKYIMKIKKIKNIIIKAILIKDEKIKNRLIKANIIKDETSDINNIWKQLKWIKRIKDEIIKAKLLKILIMKSQIIQNNLVKGQLINYISNLIYNFKTKKIKVKLIQALIIRYGFIQDNIKRSLLIQSKKKKLLFIKEKKEKKINFKKNQIYSYAFIQNNV